MMLRLVRPISRDPKRRSKAIGVSHATLLVASMAFGCSSKHPESPPTAGPKSQAEMPAAIVSPNEPDQTRGVGEGQRVARERADVAEKESRPANEMTHPSVDPQAWFREFEQLRDERRLRVGRLTDRMSRQILTALSQVPPRDENKRFEWLEDYNRFSTSRGTAIPLRPELRQEGLDYIRERLPLEKAYTHPMQRLLRQNSGRADRAHLEMVQTELTEIEKVIAELERIQPLLQALPPREKPVEVAGKLETPRDTPSPAQSAGTASGATTPITKTEGDDDRPVPRSWKVRADPGTPWPTFPESFPWEELRGIHPNLVVYPPGPAAFFAAGVGQANPQIGGWFTNLLVGDIRTGKPVGAAIKGLNRQARPTELHWRPALSPNGERAAFLGSAGTIQVVETKTGKKLHQFPIERTSEYALLFADSDHLLALDVAQQKKGIVYDLKRGKPTTTFAVDKDLESNAGHVAISPGGRFLALACCEESGLPDLIVFFDLTTGDLAGEIYPGGRGGRMPPQINSLAFSPDGKELAAFGAYPDRANLFAHAPTLFVWSLATGREVHRVTVDTGQRGSLTGHTSPEPLQWFPDQQALLINQSLVIRREDGKLLDVIRAEGDVNAHYATKILDDTRVLTADHRQRLVIRTVKRK